MNSLLNQLSQLAGERRSAVVLVHDRPTGVLPLWPTDDGLLAVAWTRSGDPETYRLITLGERVRTGQRSGAPVTVPPLDLARGAFLRPQAGLELPDGAVGPRAVLEGVALAARFGLDVQLCYLKAGAEAADWRRLGKLALREDLVVASDQTLSAARSFRFERIIAVKVQEGVPAPRWTGNAYTL